MIYTVPKYSTLPSSPPPPPLTPPPPRIGNGATHTLKPGLHIVLSNTTTLTIPAVPAVYLGYL